MVKQFCYLQFLIWNSFSCSGNVLISKTLKPVCSLELSGLWWRLLCNNPI